MNISFNWNQEIELDQQKTIEDEITAIIKNRELMHCHEGAIEVSIIIEGPLNEKFKGTTVCECGKKLMDFTGSPYSSKISFLEYKK